MENKLGRKSMQDWQKMTDALTARVYKSGFYAGYDAAKDETPDVEEMAKSLADRYTNEELSEMLLILDSVLAPSRVKSANEQRAELIQRAREFVEDWKTIDGGSDTFSNDNFPCGLWFNGGGGITPTIKLEFRVNEKKRTVVALIKSISNKKIRAKGIAKCMPDEVFNADIGKAIALARALEIDVPKEFMQAVQPSHYSVGQVVKRKDERFKNSRKYRVYRIGKGSTLTILRNNDYGESAICDTTTSLDYEDENIKALQVIDDTNAQYEVTT